MIVYQVTGLFFKGRKRYIKRRVSDKNKRWYDKFYKRRGQSYWWKDIEDDYTKQHD